MKLSIITVGWKVKDLLRECLTSIFEQTQNIDFEVFVIDNNSGDGTAEMVQNEFPQVNLIINPGNSGFAKANNQAIVRAKGEYVLLLNPDTRILDRALDKMVSFMESKTNCGIGACKLLNSDLSLQPSIRRFPKLIDQVLILLKVQHLFANLKIFKNYLATDFDYAQDSQVDQVMGAFMLIRRGVIDQIGMLDEEFWIWFEEVDFCQRTKKAGWEVWYTPRANIVHHFGQSFKQKMSFEKQKIFNASMRLYFKKHHSRLAYWTLLLVQPISLILAWGYQTLRKK
ncbi:MAG: glycosyltransferase family 2 protein [Patescibacteria group bacterium]